MAASKTFGICASCNTDLDKPFETTKGFIPTSSGFKSLCTNPIHNFARNAAAPASTGPASKKKTKSKLGSLLPVIESVSPLAPGLTTLDQPPIDEAYVSQSSSDNDESDQDSERTAQSMEHANLKCPLDVTLFLQLDECGKNKVLAGIDRICKVKPTFGLHPQVVAIRSVVSTWAAEKAGKENVNELKARIVDSKSNSFKTSVIEITAPLEDRVVDSKTNSIENSAVGVIAPLEDRIVDSKSNSIKTSAIEIIAPLEGPAKAAAAIEAVAAAKRAHAASKVRDALKLTPPSVVSPPTPASSQTIPLDFNLANAHNQSKKMRIAAKLVDRLHVQELQAKKQLFNGSTHVGGNQSDDGIHVFVDASNIQIGLINALKKAAGISDHVYTTNQAPFIFECLAFILERGRQVAKRELVGSSLNDERPAYFSDAEDCGYMVAAPERVKKMKTTIKRGYNGMDDVSTTKLTMTEQLVDELIHMKMLESIVDADEPSTMVLATGDANVAEYSGGFYKQVERALKNGWKVEVVTWKNSMANAWKKLKQTNSWGDKFMILQLDEFREELVGEKAPGSWW